MSAPSPPVVILTALSLVLENKNKNKEVNKLTRATFTRFVSLTLHALWPPRPLLISKYYKYSKTATSEQAAQSILPDLSFPPVIHLLKEEKTSNKHLTDRLSENQRDEEV